MEDPKTARLCFKGSWILATFDIHIDITFSYIMRKNTKLHFLESQQKPLKTRQHSYQ